MSEVTWICFHLILLVEYARDGLVGLGVGGEVRYDCDDYVKKFVP